MNKHYDAWAQRLSSWGYVALQIDSIGSSEKSSLNNLPSKKAEDFCAAKQYLTNLPFVTTNELERSHGRSEELRRLLHSAQGT